MSASLHEFNRGEKMPRPMISSRKRQIPARLSEEQWSEVRRLLDQGKTNQQIVVETGLRPWAVDAMGVVIRNKLDHPRRDPMPTYETCAELGIRVVSRTVGFYEPVSVSLPYVSCLDGAR